MHLPAVVVGPSDPGLEDDPGERRVRDLDRSRRRGRGQDEGRNRGGKFKFQIGSGKSDLTRLFHGRCCVQVVERSLVFKKSWPQALGLVLYNCTEFSMYANLCEQNHCLNFYSENRLAHANFSVNFSVNIFIKFYSTEPWRQNCKLNLPVT